MYKVKRFHKNVTSGLYKDNKDPYSFAYIKSVFWLKRLGHPLLFRMEGKPPPKTDCLSPSKKAKRRPVSKNKGPWEVDQVDQHVDWTLSFSINDINKRLDYNHNNKCPLDEEKSGINENHLDEEFSRIWGWAIRSIISIGLWRRLRRGNNGGKRDEMWANKPVRQCGQPTIGIRNKRAVVGDFFKGRAKGRAQSTQTLYTQDTDTHIEAGQKKRFIQDTNNREWESRLFIDSNNPIRMDNKGQPSQNMRICAP